MLHSEPGPIDTLDQFYANELAHPERAITEHLPYLRNLATGLTYVCEFGVRHGASASAFLLGADFVYSYDIKETSKARRLQAIVGSRWTYTIASSLSVRIPMCDLLFIDSLHTYAQCDQELHAHAHRVRRYLVFHDTLTFGSVGADGETGRQQWAYQAGISVPLPCLGIRPAIDALQVRDPSWRLVYSSARSHGLLVLERCL